MPETAKIAKNREKCGSHPFVLFLLFRVI